MFLGFLNVVLVPDGFRGGPSTCTFARSARVGVGVGSVTLAPVLQGHMQFVCVSVLGNGLDTGLQEVPQQLGHRFALDGRTPAQKPVFCAIVGEMEKQLICIPAMIAPRAREQCETRERREEISNALCAAETQRIPSRVAAVLTLKRFRCPCPQRAVMLSTFVAMRDIGEMLRPPDSRECRGHPAKNFFILFIHRPCRSA